MGQSDPSRLRQLVGPCVQAFSRWLLAPRRRRAALLRQQLLDGLEAALSAGVEDSPQGLVIVQGALALSLADGQFGLEEWELYAACLARLRLSEEQRRHISLQSAPDVARISSSLASIADPNHRRAIARSYCLFAAADGQEAGAELRLLRSLLQCLGYPELEQDLPALYGRFRYAESWWDRQRSNLGEWLARWGSPRRRR